MSAAATSANNALILRRLYRSLLRAAGPFSDEAQGPIAACFIHRTGMDDSINLEKLLGFHESRRNKHEKQQQHLQTSSAQPRRSVEEARDLSKSYVPTKKDAGDSTAKESETTLQPHHIRFRFLLREIMSSCSDEDQEGLANFAEPAATLHSASNTGAAGQEQHFRQMQFPSHIETNKIRDLIRREFRLSNEESFGMDESERKQLAFLALRELNRKLSWYDSLVQQKHKSKIQERHPNQAALNVSPLPLDDPKSYLKSGTFLVANPLLTGYFARSVICILDHAEEDIRNDDDGGTYGLVVNKIGVDRDTGLSQKLTDILRTVPSKLADVFGEMQVRDGGPVHMSLQMIHAQTPDQPTIGGNVLVENTYQEDNTNTVESSAMDTDRAVYYQGDVLRAAIALREGDMDRNDFSFYVGASCWTTKQLEHEIARGVWFPCKGPASIALTGQCEHATAHSDSNNDSRGPKEDLWLSMMSAIGEHEAELAHLHYFANDRAFEASDLQGPSDQVL